MFRLVCPLNGVTLVTVSFIVQSTMTCTVNCTRLKKFVAWDELDLALALAPLYLTDDSPRSDVGIDDVLQNNPADGRSLPSHIHIVGDRWWVKRLHKKEYPIRKDLVIPLDLARIRKLANEGKSNREIQRITGYGRNRISRALKED